jgi:hypothetical protein
MSAPIWVCCAPLTVGSPGLSSTICIFHVSRSRTWFSTGQRVCCAPAPTGGAPSCSRNPVSQRSRSTPRMT